MDDNPGAGSKVVDYCSDSRLNAFASERNIVCAATLDNFVGRDGISKGWYGPEKWRIFPCSLCRCCHSLDCVLDGTKGGDRRWSRQGIRRRYIARVQTSINHVQHTERILDFIVTSSSAEIFACLVRAQSLKITCEPLSSHVNHKRLRRS